MLRRLCTALALGILAIAGFAPSAAADPIGAKNSFVAPVTCDGQSVELVINGNGDFTPGHVRNSTAVFVLQSFDLIHEFTPPGGPTESESASRSKGNPHGDLVTCEFNFSVTAPEGTFRIVGTITGFFTPASEGLIGV